MSESLSSAAAERSSRSVPILTLRDVGKVYKSDLFRKRQVAVEALSCQLPAGACTGLLGHNGAGKTTTIRIILGLIRPDSGQVDFEGQVLSHRAKAFIGYMPEVNKLPAALTPVEILMQQLRLCAPAALTTHAQRQEAIDRLLDNVALTAHRHKAIGKLSKGMARRLAWAQAVIHQPRLLILDEPASGLDPLGRQQMMSWIAAEKQRGTSILLCTHELNQVQSLCDEVLILSRGRVAYSSLDREHAAGWRWPHPYNLQVSGVDQPLLSAVRSKRGLTAWQGLRTSGFATTLGFDAYEDATAWLTALLAENLVILRFGEANAIAEEELLRYFKGDA